MQISDNGSHFTVCSKPEMMLLNDLSREFGGRMKVVKSKTHDSEQVTIETDTTQLRDFIFYKINNLRDNKQKLEKTYTKNMSKDELIAYDMFKSGIYKNFSAK